MDNQEAIETLKANYPDPCFEMLREAVDIAISALKAQMNGDTISRQAAIDTVTEYEKLLREILGDKNELAEVVKNVKHRIIALPSAQPEIMRCKDCVHSDTFPEGADNDMPLKCLGIRYGGVMPDWYCEHAERRTDEPD